MTRLIAVIAIAFAAILLLGQQRAPTDPGFEMTSVFPHESSPGQYTQVEQSRIQDLSSQGWELVAVTPYVYRNEEHNNGEMHGPKPVITQVYPAYFFRRVRRR